MQIAKISDTKLRKLGFYKEYRIDRVGKTLDELLEDSDEFALAESIVVPTQQDYKILSERVLITIRKAATLHLPTPQQCRGILDSEGAAVWPTLVPANLGVKLKTNKTDRKDDIYSDPFNYNASLAALEQTEENSETKVEIPLTFYEMNDMVIDEVLHGDPGSYAVIKKLSNT